jgi:hypothetical protein
MHYLPSFVAVQSWQVSRQKIAKISGLAYWELCGAPLSSELLALCAITPMVCEMPQFQFKIYHSPATKVWHFPSAWCFPNQGVPVAQYR